MAAGLTRKEFLKGAAAIGAAGAVGGFFLRPTETTASVVRPPGALPEEEFLARCIRCSRCVQACPNQCITPFTPQAGSPFSLVPGHAEEGTPAIFPRRKPCNLCANDPGDELCCTAACPSGALRIVPKTLDDIHASVSMGVATVDEHLCWSYNDGSCGVCVRACPLRGKALKAGMFERPIVDPLWCVGCGLCERACVRYPQAISIDPSRRRTV